MKSALFILVLSLSTCQALSQVNKPCFFVPQSVSINDLNAIDITNECMITSFSFQLFNRWGELLRETKKMTNPLNFNSNESDVSTAKKKKKKAKNNEILNKPVTSGVYFFIITYTLPGKNESEKQTGNITFY